MANKSENSRGIKFHKPAIEANTWHFYDLVSNNSCLLPPNDVLNLLRGASEKQRQS